MARAAVAPIPASRRQGERVIIINPPATQVVRKSRRSSMRQRSSCLGTAIDSSDSLGEKASILRLASAYLRARPRAVSVEIRSPVRFILVLIRCTIACSFLVHAKRIVAPATSGYTIFPTSWLKSLNEVAVHGLRGQDDSEAKLTRLAANRWDRRDFFPNVSTFSCRTD